MSLYGNGEGSTVRLWTALLISLLGVGTVLAGEGPSSLEQAKRLASNSGKPILLEFHRQSCPHCAESAQDAESDPQMRQALETVVHLSLDASAQAGRELSREYNLGAYTPLFVLTNAGGDVIRRWAGYTGSARFITELRRAMSDRTTIKERMATYQTNPTRQTALLLARHLTDMADYRGAVRFYRDAQRLGTVERRDYSFEIFENSANAAWNDALPFDSAIAAADLFLKSPKVRADRVRTMALMLSNLARKNNFTDRIAKYLQAGIEASRGQDNPAFQKALIDFRADSALYVAHDTSGAIGIKKQGMGSTWQDFPKQYFGFGSWCFQRKINLEEAELWVRKATNLSSDGPFKARHLNLLADICFARGKTKEAARIEQEAIDNDPENERYRKQLKRFSESLQPPTR
ncbi:MAG: thioredoxin family protein [Candidatus Zixiibacteriota bacterium]